MHNPAILVGKFDKWIFSASITYISWEVALDGKPLIQSPKLTHPFNWLFIYIYIRLLFEKRLWLLIITNPNKIFNHFTLFFTRKAFHFFFTFSLRCYQWFSREFLLHVVSSCFQFFISLNSHIFLALRIFSHFYSFVFSTENTTTKIW